jgi:EAL domain-containing protein (putative c-di-GMP-specific phosphodiesterase class I)
MVEACGFARRARKAGLKSLRIAVPINGTQFADPELADVIMRVIRKQGVPNRAFSIVVPEPAVRANVDAAVPIVNELRLRGLQTTLNGISSIPRTDLARIGFYSVRAEMGRSTQSASGTAELTSFVEIALHAGLPVLIAGVRSQHERALFEQLGCTHEVSDELLGGDAFLLAHGTKRIAVSAPAAIEALPAPGSEEREAS